MILRSGKMIGADNVLLDFDYASWAWRLNKIYTGEGRFQYKRSRTR